VTAPHTGADALLERLTRTTLVVGKGGVGKTTCAVAIASEFAARGSPSLVVSADPAAALSSVLGAHVGSEAERVAGSANLYARQLSADVLRARFLAQWRDIITEIVDRGTYLDREDVAGLVDSAMPGADEIFALLALGELLVQSEYERIVVDTAPTGHTLRLLQLPETFSALVALLDAMQDKHRFMVRALTHRYRADAADAFLHEMRERIDAIRTALTDATRVTAVLVTRPDAVVEAETERYLVELRRMGISVSALLVNAVAEAGDATLPPAGATPPETFTMPRIAPPPQGADETRELLRRIAQPTGIARRAVRSGGRGSRESPQPTEPLPVDRESLVRPLTIIGGKGGVGKTTAACALAVAIATADAPVLLVSTDPAASIADAMDASDAPWALNGEEHALPDVPGLTVRQMDASAAFARLRDRYRQQVDAIFDAVVARGVDAAADRAIVRDLLALAPPGVDEVYALSILSDALAEQRFARVIVDPAPTGHLLRLLEMPAIAVDWAHRLLRLMLKYKELTGLGETTAEILQFSRRTRALGELLVDKSRAGMLIVALDEPVVRAETERLASAVGKRGIATLGVLWNRYTACDAPAPRRTPLPSSVIARQFCAPVVVPPPSGSAALRAWSHRWRSI
jgi:arsenite-transporting ATPase